LGVLAGESKMAFVVCVSAALSNSEETVSSLQFAARAVTVEQHKAIRHVTQAPPVNALAAAAVVAE
jgi:hypothetical protein